MRKAVYSLLLIGFLAPFGQAEQKLSLSEAKQHIGACASVFGAIARTLLRSGVAGNPPSLNFETPYPNQIFTVLIWGDKRVKSAHPKANTWFQET